ncbi:MAG: diaminopimelate epimerase [Leptospiraceae bacterium]|nr:diaminopimelate epimerase [Leptospiraceae bacterium]
MTKLNFTKMEGIGNDYVYIDATKSDIQLSTEQIQKISNRNFGVGSDGVIFIRPSKVADFQMDMYNSDGSSSEMCGNGIRCVGKFVYDFGLTNTTTPKIETGKGVLELKLDVQDSKVSYVTVDMGEPILVPEKIPVIWDNDKRIIEAPLEILGHSLKFTAVSMGNPHAVIFVDDPKTFPVHEVGSKIETHSLFPRRTNVEFVSVLGKDHLFQRTWERGAGETLACGTGACAVAVASNLTGRCGRSVQIDLLGGSLFIDWTEKGNVIMKGPAKTTFQGVLEI